MDSFDAFLFHLARACFDQGEEVSPGRFRLERAGEVYTIIFDVEKKGGKDFYRLVSITRG